MSDLTAGGTIDYSSHPTYDARRNMSAHDIRRTAPPTPTVIGTANITSTGAFVNANDAVFGDGTSKGLNSGILIRAVDSNTSNTLFVGFTAPSLTTGQCFVLESDDEMFVPCVDFGQLEFQTAGANGMTISVLGE